MYHAMRLTKAGIPSKHYIIDLNKEIPDGMLTVE